MFGGAYSSGFTSLSLSFSLLVGFLRIVVGDLARADDDPRIPFRSSTSRLAVINRD